jgi:hypothetical protein
VRRLLAAVLARLAPARAATAAPLPEADPHRYCVPGRHYCVDLA